FCGCFSLFLFFQAEDGIRDRNVTGVQTCALPICCGTHGSLASIGTTWWRASWYHRLCRSSPRTQTRATSMRSHCSPMATDSVLEIGRASYRERVWTTVDAGVLHSSDTDIGVFVSG